jgi:hypothetical protein
LKLQQNSHISATKANIDNIIFKPLLSEYRLLKNKIKNDNNIIII